MWASLNEIAGNNRFARKITHDALAWFQTTQLDVESERYRGVSVLHPGRKDLA